MKIICEGSELYDALSKVARALPVKKTNPVLDGIKITAKDDTITMFATDFELSIEKKINAEVLIEGDIVVPGKVFVDYAKTVAEEKIELISTSDNVIVIHGLNSSANIKCLDKNDYPRFNKSTSETSFAINKKDFKELIGKIIFSIATDDIRPALKGCSLLIKNGQIEGVASDGYRLALCRKPISYTGEKLQIVVPAKSLTEIAKLVDDENSDIEIIIDKNKLIIDLYHTVIETRLIGDEFINYEKVFPQTVSTEIFVEKKKFENAIERASLISRNEKRGYIKLEIKEDSMLINAQSETGESDDKIDLKMDGKDLTIGFNAKYLIDCLKAINDPFIKMVFTTSTAPGIIKENAETSTWQYLILPLRSF